MRVFIDKLTGSVCEIINPNLYSVYENSPVYEEKKETESKKTAKSK